MGVSKTIYQRMKRNYSMLISIITYTYLQEMKFELPERESYLILYNWKLISGASKFEMKIALCGESVSKFAYPA